jgi:hypothetical protein
MHSRADYSLDSGLFFVTVRKLSVNRAGCARVHNGPVVDTGASATVPYREEAD